MLLEKSPPKNQKLRRSGMLIPKMQTCRSSGASHLRSAIYKYVAPTALETQS